MEQVIKSIFPGFEYDGIYTLHNFIPKLVRPVLQKQFPDIEKMDVTKALKKLGDKVDVAKVKDCHGYEWQNWPEWKK